MAKIELTQQVKEILDNSTVAGKTLTLPEGQLDRKLYVEVNKVLEALGGKWNKKQKCHIFAEDVESALQNTIKTEKVAYVDLKKELNFFETPPEVAKRMVELANVDSNSWILEPNIGRGGIAKFCPNKRAVVGYDIHKPFLDALQQDVESYGSLYHMDFLKATPSWLSVGSAYDAAIMNPPFYNGADIKHVTHALKFVKPGRPVVAIVSKGWAFRSGRLWERFRKIVDKKAIWREDLRAGTFKDAGTNVATTLLVLLA